MTAAAKLIIDDAQLATGKVRLGDGRSWTVSLERQCGGAHEVTARRAASCLLEPASGDEVLVALAAQPFIIAVLVRDEGHPAAVRFDGDVRIDSAGRLELGAARGIGLRTPAALSMMVGKLRLEARVAELVTERLSTFGRQLRACFDDAGLVAKACDLAADRLASHLKRSYRSVEEYEQLRARHIDHRAEQTLQLKAETTVVTARQVAKIDGAQVHIG